MDAISTFKGYGKVSHLESQNPDRRPRRRPLLTTIAISAAILLTLIIGLVLAAAVIPELKEKKEEDNSESIKSVCSVTRYPDSCFAAISSLKTPTKKPDPEFIFKLSLRAATSSLSKLSSSFKTVNNRKSAPAAVQDCVTQLEEALDRLNQSMSAMEVGPGEKMLTESKIKDIQTWISAAMTDQSTCFDGLEEVGSRVSDQIQNQRQRSEQYMSNSLAIVAKMPSLLEKSGLKLH